VILVIGVNGLGQDDQPSASSGHLLQEQDYGVMLAAGDTFRAAAIEQLRIWGERIKGSGD
jgi:fused signal recognition particle receptor